MATAALIVCPLAASGQIVIENAAPVDTGDGRPESFGVLDFGDSTALDPETRPVLVFLDDKLISGRRGAIYRGGTLYLDGDPWRPMPIRPSWDWRFPARTRAQVDSMILARVPFVQSSVRSGTPLRSAVLSYESRVHANLDEVVEIHRRELVRRDWSDAARIAAAHIDTSLAIGDVNAPEAPRFGLGGSVSMYFRGYRRFYAGPGRLGATNRVPRDIISRDEARVEVEGLRHRLSVRHPEVIIYTEGGKASYSGNGSYREFAAALRSGEIRYPFDWRSLDEIAFRAKRRSSPSKER